MVNSLIASVALFAASAIADSVGKAVVVNQCSYDVYLCNVPSADGGYESIDKTLSPGDSYSQEWTELSNTNGWSIKLSQDDNNYGSHIMQYEYTFHNDGIIWYDLSCVNGNPWDQDWEITASSGCDPKQQAYRYSTDDAYGMQSCSSDADITVTLCTGKSADNGTAFSGSGSGSGSDSGSSSSASASSYQSSSSAAASAPSYQSTSASAPSYQSLSSSEAPTSTATPSSTTAPGYGVWTGYGGKDKQPQTTPTTFATSTTAATETFDGVVVTEYETAVVTAVVTAYADKAKRGHEHHQHGHAHRHM